MTGWPTFFFYLVLHIVVHHVIPMRVHVYYVWCVKVVVRVSEWVLVRYSVFSCDFAISKLNYKNVVRMIDIQRHALLGTCRTRSSICRDTHSSLTTHALPLTLSVSVSLARHSQMEIGHSFHPFLFPLFYSLFRFFSVECDATVCYNRCRCVCISIRLIFNTNRL